MSKGAAGVDFTHFLAMEWAARHDAAASDFTLCAALRQRYDAETRKKAASIGQTMTDLDTSVVAAMQRASEAERVNRNTNHAGWLQAKLLDSIDGREAWEWLDAHKDDPGAVLARYDGADDREDGAFVREVERRNGFAPDEPDVPDDDRGVHARRSTSPRPKRKATPSG